MTSGTRCTNAVRATDVILANMTPNNANALHQQVRKGTHLCGSARRWPLYDFNQMHHLTGLDAVQLRFKVQHMRSERVPEFNRRRR